MAISAAQYQTCVVLRDGSVACWGNSPDGIANHDIPVTVDAGVDAQCSSDGMTGQVIMVGSTPGVVPCVSSAVMVAAGQATNCALISDGSIRCWGYGFTGALGNGNVDGPIEEQTGGMVGPVEVSNIHTAVAVSVTQSACALLADGTVECWGPNMSGELGNGTTERSYVPVLVQDLSNASAVAIGGPNGNHECETCVGYACAVLSNGTVECWGQDQYGELGNGTTSLDAGTVPAPVPGLTGVVSIVAGSGDVFAVLTDGTAMAWGQNLSGELGNGTMEVVTSPGLVQGLAHVTAIRGGSSHACALLSDGSVWCWGDNALGELGAGPGGPASSLTPIQVKF